MGAFVLTDCTVFVGGYDLSSDSNKLTVALTADELDATPFKAGGYHKRLAGLKSGQIDHEGFVSYPDEDGTLWSDISAERLVTVCPTGVEGDVAYFMNARRLAYTPVDATVGEIANFQGSASSSDGVGVARGRLILPPTRVTGIASAISPIMQLGAIETGQKLYVAVHCFSAAGSSAAVTVKSAATIGFTGATVRWTSDAITAPGGVFAAVDLGAITDTYWEARVDAGADFEVAVALAIQ
ncbi:MAG TPA: hypothetical protein VG899_12420 [Mycobacteriales bacterium]|nr:hypothetical protein [Mycobacteriales bacterium]